MKYLGAGALGAALTLTLSARATITEPNGAVYPVDSANGEIQLYTLFQQRGEPIDYRVDGQSTPATFSPLCDFKATFVLNEAGSHFGVGWYNAPASSRPQPGVDIYPILAPNSPVGTVINAADIRNDPNYLGGAIGFALLGGQTHYSEPEWNPEYAPGQPWIMAIIYASKVTPNAYYLAFEDGNVSGASFNNDGDFNDDVFFFEGLTCSGGGADCDSGQPGVCRAGLTQCDGVTCQAVSSPSPEACNGLDDDCNGVLDEGELCDPGFVCDHGACVRACGTGEFKCSGDTVCSSDGYCVAADCAKVTCDTGKVCVHGKCQAPCDDVVCPSPQVCRAGRCVDPCVGVTCDSGKVCMGGVCRSSCVCAPCASGLACDSASGRCEEAACVGVTCAPGEHCDAGACVDSCAGARCPAGQACTLGQCAEAPDAGASGGAAGSLSFGGSGGVSSGSGGLTSAGGASAASGASAAGGAPSRGASYADSGSACGCRAPTGRGGAVGAALGLAGLGLIAAARRRTRR
ncbi:MAG: hypothetical protein OZ921_05125 [Sorangiineae bacterium]|nr:hypothetical protein [Polyangiaceae bacterium]MEB2321874.1 hypothetical protein [Sorangiineae bacterium]